MLSNVRGRTGKENEKTTKPRALIIAIRNYARLPQLRNAVCDGVMLDHQLHRMKWDSKLCPDLTRSELSKAIKEFVLMTGDAERCIFAFVGHGIGVNGNHYLVPKDADVPQSARNAAEFERFISDSCTSLTWVQQIFADTRKGNNPTVFVLDCCRSCDWKIVPAGGLLEIGSGPPAPKPPLRNSYVAYSTADGFEAWDGNPGDGGPFMTAFVQSIQNGGDMIEIMRRTRIVLDSVAGHWQLAESDEKLLEPFWFETPPAAQAPADPAGGAKDSASAPLQAVLNTEATPPRRAEVECSQSALSVAAARIRPDSRLLRRLHEEKLGSYAQLIVERLGAETVEDLENHVQQSDVDKYLSDLPPVPERKLKELLKRLQREAASSGASTPEASPPPSPSPEAVVMLRNVGDVTDFRRLTKEFINEFRKKVYAAAWADTTGQVREGLSFCAIVLLNLLCNDSIATPEVHESGTEWFRDFRTRGERFDDGVLAGFVAVFEHANFSRSAHDLVHCEKRGRFCVSYIDKHVRSIPGCDLEAWDRSVVRSWFHTAEPVDAFLLRADGFFSGSCWEESKIRMLGAIETQSFQSFIVLDRFTELLLFAFLQWMATERDDVHGFVSAVSSTGSSWHPRASAAPDQRPGPTRESTVWLRVIAMLDLSSAVGPEADDAGQGPVASRSHLYQAIDPSQIGGTDDYRTVMAALQVSLERGAGGDPWREVRQFKCNPAGPKEEDDLESVASTTRMTFLSRDGSRAEPEDVVDRMRHCSDDAAILTEACATICAIAEESIESQDKVADAHCMEQVMVAMRRHLGHSGLQEAASMAIINSTWRHPDNQATAVAADAIPLLIAGMRAHSQNERVQEMASWAFANLVTNNETAEARAGAEGFIELIVDTLATHRQSVEVQRAACRALGALTMSNRDNQERAVTSGVIDAVVQCMRVHKDEQSHELANQILYQIVRPNCQDSQERAGAAGAVEEVVLSMKLHTKHASVEEWACSALSALTNECPGNQQRASAVGAVEAVVQAMKEHKHAAIHQVACGALAALNPIRERLDSGMSADVTQDMSRHIGCSEAEVIRQVVESMRAHFENPTALYAACLALISLTLHRPENQDVAGMSGAIETVVKGMIENKLDIAIACVALATLSQEHGDNSVRAGHAGAIEGLSALMSAHPLNSELQAAMMTALGSITWKCEENRRSAGEAGAVGHVVAWINTQTEDKQKRVLGWKTLICLVLGQPENKARAAAAGAIEPVLDVLRDTAEDTIGHRAALLVLCELTCDHPENQTRAGDVGMIESLVDLMLAHLDVVLTQAGACTLLLEMTKLHKENQVKAVDAGAIEVLVSAIRRHRRDVIVQQQACAAVQFLMRGSLDAQDRARMAGVIPEVVEVMREHVDSADIQIGACGALCEMTTGRLQNKLQAGAVGAIEQVVVCLHAHQHDIAVATQACQALLNMTMEQPENQERAGLAGALEHIVKLVQMYKLEAGLVSAALSAVSALGLGHVENQGRAARAGLIAVALECMRHHKLDVGIIRTACAAMGIVTSGHSGNQARAVETGAIEEVLQAMRTHEEEESVQAAASEALEHIISIHHDYRQRAVEAGAAELLVRSMHAHVHAAELQIQACRTLRQLCWGLAEANSKDIAVLAGAIEAVLGAMRSYVENPEVQEVACEVLGTLTFGHVDNQRRAGQAGAVEQVVEAMRNHTEVAMVQQTACAALGSMTAGNSENDARARAAGATPGFFGWMPFRNQVPEAPENTLSTKPTASRASPQTSSFSHDSQDDSVAPVDADLLAPNVNLTFGTRTTFSIAFDAPASGHSRSGGAGGASCEGRGLEPEHAPSADERPAGP